jgi:hypothetical protein
MGGSIGESALVCQGQIWHSMLRAGGFPWARAFRAGTVRWERKGEQARDLLRHGVLSEKGRRSPSRPHLDFLAHGRRSDGYMGSLKNERLLIQVRCRSGRSSINDFQMLYVTKPVFSSDQCGLCGIILCEFFSIVKS